MSPLPTTPTSTGESWEMVETARRVLTAELDWLVEVTFVCDCPHKVDGLEHYDMVAAVAQNRYSPTPGILYGLLAEAVTRLAAARKAGDRS